MGCTYLKLISLVNNVGDKPLYCFCSKHLYTYVYTIHNFILINYCMCYIFCSLDKVFTNLTKFNFRDVYEIEIMNFLQYVIGNS